MSTVSNRWVHTVVGAALAVLVPVGLAGCADDVSGQGSARTASPSSAGPTDFPATSVPATSDAPPTASDTPEPSSSAPPTPVAPPANCRPSTCKEVASGDVGDGYRVVLRGDASGAGGLGVSAVELAYQGTSVFWVVNEGETPAGIECSAEPAKNCVTVAYVGAHGAIARSWKVVGNTLAASGEAQSSTPNMQSADLNGDGYVDARGLQSTYEPDHATGKVFWQTWTSDGSTLASTGCGPQASTKPPAPTTPQSGACS